MTAAEILVVSDTHLSERAPEALANWDAVVAYAEATGPTLVVHLGDLSLDGANDPAELPAARRQLDRLAVPWVAIPGNHDIGDNPSPDVPVAWHLDGARLGRWLDAVGPDRFHVEVGGVHLLGIDSMLAGSGLDAEEEQWAWVGGRLATVEGGATVVLASHKPLAASGAEIAAASAARFVPPPARRRLEGLLDGFHAPVVISGHVHQHRRLSFGGRTHVWAPATWAVLPDRIQPRVGEKRCAALRLTVGGGRIEAAVIEPPGIGQYTLGQDIPDPYARH